MTHLILLYDAVMGTIGGIGLLYLLYLQTFELGSEYFLDVTVLGLFVFAASPLFEVVLPAWVHLVHGTGALLVVFGLYSPVDNELRREEWEDLLLRDPTTARNPGDWMVPMDTELMELFHSTDLVLTPAILAYNTGHSREAVNRRLSELETHNFVERVERGKYRLTDRGVDYLQGTLNARLIQ